MLQSNMVTQNIFYGKCNFVDTGIWFRACMNDYIVTKLLGVIWDTPARIERKSLRKSVCNDLPVPYTHDGWSDY